MEGLAVTFGINRAGSQQAQPSDEIAAAGAGVVAPAVGPVAQDQLLALARLLGCATARRWLADQRALAADNRMPAGIGEPPSDIEGAA
jgi:hypothetical protein